MTYLSVCSGIEAATVAWHPLGWHPWAFAEVDKFPSAVLAHHYPNVPNLGDMTKFQEWPDAAIDVLVGGTPCQSFSVAGLRAGLDDPRGSLMLVYLAIARRYRPRWVVWENVPGVLSSDDGRAFGTLLQGLADLGYGFAYRVFDAQHFGLAQRRARVFVVGYLGDWRRAAAVLFESASLSGHPAPRREAGQSAPTLPSRRTAGGGLGTDFDCDGGLDGFDASEDGTGRGTPLVPVIAPCLTGNYGKQPDSSDTSAGPMLIPVAEPYTLAIRGRGDSHDLEYRQDGTANALLTPNGGRGGIGVGAIAHAFDARQSDVIQYGDQSGPLDTDGHTIGVLAVVSSGRGWCDESDVGATIRAQDSVTKADTLAVHGMQVRRLTPRECERLQGFPDDYTLIPVGKKRKPAADGPRYKALGNSMAVPVMRWIGERIAAVERIA